MSELFAGECAWIVFHCDSVPASSPSFSPQSQPAREVPRRNLTLHRSNSTDYFADAAQVTNAHIQLPQIVGLFLESVDEKLGGLKAIDIKTNTGILLEVRRMR